MKRLQEFFCLFLRVALAVGFLSAVADRFGLWGSPGSANAVWGDFGYFQDYTAKLVSFLPNDWVPAVAWAVTAAELILGLLLLLGLFPLFTGFASGLLLLAFAISMSFALGIKQPLNYSVYIASAAAFLLGTVGPGYLALKS